MVGVLAVETSVAHHEIDRIGVRHRDVNHSGVKRIGSDQRVVGKKAVADQTRTDRILGSFRERGIVNLSNGVLEILNMRELQRLCSLN